MFYVANPKLQAEITTANLSRNSVSRVLNTMIYYRQTNAICVCVGGVGGWGLQQQQTQSSRKYILNAPNPNHTDCSYQPSHTLGKIQMKPTHHILTGNDKLSTHICHF